MKAFHLETHQMSSARKIYNLRSVGRGDVVDIIARMSLVAGGRNDQRRTLREPMCGWK